MCVVVVVCVAGCGSCALWHVLLRDAAVVVVVDTLSHTSSAVAVEGNKKTGQDKSSSERDSEAVHRGYPGWADTRLEAEQLRLLLLLAHELHICRGVG